MSRQHHPFVIAKDLLLKMLKLYEQRIDNPWWNTDPKLSSNMPGDLTTKLRQRENPSRMILDTGIGGIYILIAKINTGNTTPFILYWA